MDAEERANIQETVIYKANSEGGDFLTNQWTHSSAKYGDLWISSNTTSSIHRWQNSIGGSANTPSDSSTALAWRKTPTNSFGLIYLDSYNAQNVSDETSILRWEYQYPEHFDITFEREVLSSSSNIFII